jgi:hypothetical protein
MAWIDDLRTMLRQRFGVGEEFSLEQVYEHEHDLKKLGEPSDKAVSARTERRLLT